MRYLFHIVLGVSLILLLYILTRWLSMDDYSWESNASLYKFTFVAMLLVFVSFYNYKNREKAD